MATRSPRGIGARSIEQLHDGARAAGCSLHDAVSATTGKAGANLGAFVAKLDVMREQTQAMTLRDIPAGRRVPLGNLVIRALGVLILGEPFTAWIAAGTVLVISGIFVFTRSAR